MQEVVMRQIVGATVLGLVVGFAFPRPSVQAEEDYYVITYTNQSQRAAQQETTSTGGWVLDTDLYPNLAPGLYAVVRGPYHSSDEATRQLEWLQSGDDYPDAYIRNAGQIRLRAGVSSGVPPAMVAALLGELEFEVEERAGAENPCEPQAPYHRVQLVWWEPSRSPDPETGAVRWSVMRNEVRFGGFWWIDASGVVEHMRACFE
jgi:hypothetical protein